MGKEPARVVSRQNDWDHKSKGAPNNERTRAKPQDVGSALSQLAPLNLLLRLGALK
jgi:hypothetical protein